MPPEVADKLLEWERKRREGTPVTPEELCADSPEMADELRRRIRRLEACDRLLGLDETPVGQTEPDSEVPAWIDGFEVRGRLGRGGMADVYEAWDPKLRRDVAIKVLRLPVDFWPFARTQELAGRFSREGAVLARLEHPHIVPVYQGGEWQGRPYIAMARIGGGTLADRREEFTGKSPREVAAFMEKVASAVHSAHQEGVLHRDLKPANILLDDDGEPKVADFGLAKLWLADEPTECSTVDAATPSSELTAPGVQPGTPPYMAPEQLDPGLGPIGPATDVWSLGVILTELLTGKRPFAGETRRELVENVCRAPAPSCRESNPRVPRWLDAIVARCLVKEPTERYVSAAELAGALREGLRRRRRRFWVAGTAALVMLVLVAGFVAGRWIRRERPFADRPEVVASIDRLSKHEEVVLFGPDTRAPYHWLFGKDTGHEVEGDPSLLKLFGRWTGPSTAEFLPRLPAGRYRVRAVVRHDTGENFTKVALYIGGRHWQSARGEHLQCVALSFSDAGPEAANPPPGPTGANRIVSFQCLLTGQVRDQQSHWSSREAGSLQYPPPPADQGHLFRTLELVVRETSVEAQWDGQLVGTISVSMASTMLADCRIGYPELQPSAEDPHPFHGGVGLFVHNGTISVKELRISPMD